MSAPPRSWHQAVEDLKTTLQPLYDERESLSVARLALMHVLQVNQTELLLHGKDSYLLPEEEALAAQITRRLLASEPIQYILGRVPFGPLSLKVQPGVLIPRPETEELCALVVQEFRAMGASPRCILDAGTGSGCIALYLAHAFRRSDVWALDYSPQALAVAGENAQSEAERLGFTPPRLLHTNLLDPAAYPALAALQPDLIVSNPPYIPLREWQEMEDKVRRAEPQQALFVPDADPLLFYRALAQIATLCAQSATAKTQSPASENPPRAQVRLVCEGHYRYCRQVKQLWEACGARECRVYEDLNGKERFVYALFEAP